MSPSVDITLKAIDNTKAGFDSAIANANAANAALNKLGGSGQTVGQIFAKTDPYRNAAAEIANLNKQATQSRFSVDAMMGAYRKLIAYTVPIVAAGVAIKKGFEFSKMGAEINYTQIKFANLAKTIGTTSDAFLNDLRIATKGTVSDFNLLKQGSDLLNLDLAKTKDEAVRLSRVMAGLGMDTGQLTLALANQSTRRLDQLNISLDRFNKIKREVADTTGLTGQDLYKEAFLQSAEYGLERMGSKTDTQAGDYDRFTASLSNLKNSFAMSSANTFQPVVNFLNQGLQANVERQRIAQQYRDFLKANPDQKPVQTTQAGSSFITQSTSDQNFMKFAQQYASIKQLKDQRDLGKKTRGTPATNAPMGEGATVATDYGALLEGALKITSQTEKFTEATNELNAALLEENEKLDLMNQKYGEGSDKVAEQAQKVQGIKDKMQDVKQSAVDMGDAMLLANLGAKEGNEQLMLSYALASGEITQKSYDQQMAIMQISDALQSGVIPTAGEAAKAVSRVMSADGFTGKMTMDIYINYIVSGGGGAGSFNFNAATQALVGSGAAAGVAGNQMVKREASGGILGNMTLVGEEGQELIVKRGSEYVVIPADASKWMMEAGMVPGAKMAGGGTVGGRSTSRSIGGGRGGGYSSSRTSSGRGGFFSSDIGGGDVGVIISDTISEVTPAITSAVADAVTQTVTSSPQMQAVSASIETFKDMAETLSMILAKTPSESGIGRAVNGDLARTA